MKNALRQIFVISLSAMLVAVATSGAAQRPAPLTRTCDGLWSMLIITRYGDCDPAYRRSPNTSPVATPRDAVRLSSFSIGQTRK